MNVILSAEASAQLQEGINLVLSRWAALRMAVENEWGGSDSHQKSLELGRDIFLRLSHAKEQVYIDDIEDMLDDFMLSLNTEIADGSIEEIAEKLMVMREECLEGNFDSIKRLKVTNAPSVSYIKQAGTNDQDDSESSDDDRENLEKDITSEMEVDPPLPPGSNENAMTTRQGEVTGTTDGWTVVHSKRNKSKRS